LRAVVETIISTFSIVEGRGVVGEMPLTLSSPWRLRVDIYKRFLGRDNTMQIAEAGKRDEGRYVLEEAVWAFADGGVVDDKSFDGRGDDVPGLERCSCIRRRVGMDFLL
jgi:hypothetical protein